MIYTKRDFGTELKRKVSSGYTAIQIGKWAHSIFFQNCHKLNSELKEVIEKLLMMEEGPEFEYSREELMAIAEQLINDK